MTKMLKIIWADNFMTGEGKKKGTGSGWLVQTGHQSTVAKDVCFRSLGIYIYIGLPWWLSGKESACQVGDSGLKYTLGWKYTLEEEMPTHSSNLAGKIPCTEEPGRLESMGSQRVRHD
jgi:hypothetical protein